MPKSENELRQEIADAEFDYFAQRDISTHSRDHKQHMNEQTQRRLELERTKDENTADRNGTA